MVGVGTIVHKDPNGLIQNLPKEKEQLESGMQYGSGAMVVEVIVGIVVVGIVVVVAKTVVVVIGVVVVVVGGVVVVDICEGVGVKLVFVTGIVGVDFDGGQNEPSGSAQ